MDNRKKFSGRRKPYSDVSLTSDTADKELILARLDKGLTQKEMAEKLHISRPLYSLIESGKRTGKLYREQINEILKEETK